MIYKKILIMAGMLLIASSASAIPVGNGTGDITMNLTITSYAVVQVPPGDDGYGIPFDEVINFSSDVVGGTCPDFYRAFGGTERGLYNPLIASDTWPNTGEKPPTDPWANGYYESCDGADYWLTTNGGTLTMTITSGGGLTDGSHVLNTWFTLAASGPFILNGVQLDDGPIPFDGPGSYFADEDGLALAMELGNTAFWSNQYNFDMVGGGPWTYTFNGVCSGSLKFLGRVERNNINDPAGTYTTTLTVTFTP